MSGRLGLPLFILGVLVASPSFGQEMSGGGKLGLSIGHLSSNDEFFESRSKGGFVAGGFVNVAITGFLSVEPQLLFIQKGAKIAEFGEEVTLELDYLEAPLLGVVTFPSWGSVTPFVYGGPAFGLNVSAKAARVGVEIDEDIDDDVRGSDVALTFGGGINVDGLTLEARYTAGLSSIAEGERDIRTRAFHFIGGFSFPN